MSFDFSKGRPVSYDLEAPTVTPADDRVESRWDEFIPEILREDPEIHRRSRLLIRFGVLGALFGAVYSLFYAVIGHGLGALVILVCSFCFGSVPFFLRRNRNLDLTGHFYAVVLFVGFTVLSLIEGGVQGHAVAWLASVPLCVLLLIRLKSALVWTGICTLAVLFFGIANSCGVQFPKTYPIEWEAGVDLAGYAGLVPFLALLGLIFEETRRKAFERLTTTLAELSEANERLVQLNEDKNELLHIVAHDLKNPLGVISGYAGLLQMFDEHDSEEVKQQAGEILGSANRMLEIIRKLLDSRSIEAGRMDLHPTHCPVGAIVERVVRDYTQAAAAKRMTLLVQGDFDEAVVFADAVAVHQILDNLVSNAVKYAPHGKAVTIALSVPQKNTVGIQVIDQGPGLSAADQAKLFGKFTRLTPQPTGGESSNGLGLWIVQRMARLMNGDVTCRSSLGVGSTFTLQLPAGDLQGVEDSGNDLLILPS